MIAFIKNQVAGRDDVHIAKEIKTREGIDYFLSSQHFLQNLGKKLQKQFGGTLKVSAKLHTRDSQKSKDLHRVTVYYAPPRFSINDKVNVRGEIITIKSFGKKISGIDKAGRRVMFEEKDVSPAPPGTG